MFPESSAITVILLILAVAGLLDAVYLSYAHLFGSDVCRAGSGCDAVLASAWSTGFGIPISAYGAGLYTALVVAVRKTFDSRKRAAALRWAFVLSAVGTLASLFLVYLQAFVIEAWCPFCMASTFILLAILSLTAAAVRREGIGLLSTRLSPEVWVPVLLPLLVVPPVYVPLQRGVDGLKTTPSSEPFVVARIGERRITADEIDAAIRLKLYEERDVLRKEWLDRQVLETAAAEQGLDARTLVQQEVYSKIEVSDDEIDRRFEQIRHRLPPDVTRASVARSIRNEIGNRKSKEALDAFVDKLKERYGTTFTVPPSERFGLDPNPRGGPSKGPEDAPVTIVEFSDFECGYCARAHEYLKDLLARRGDTVRLVFRHLPLDMHDHAGYAAEVGACVHRQDGFWPYADRIFAARGDLTDDRILSLAVAAGADSTQLVACLESGTGREMVDADIAEADALGVTSTPTLFVNGRYIGSIPRTGLDAIIDRELEATPSR